MNDWHEFDRKSKNNLDVFILAVETECVGFVSACVCVCVRLSDTVLTEQAAVLNRLAFIVESDSRAETKQ